MVENRNSNPVMRFQNSEYKLEISATDSFIQRYIKTLINNGSIQNSESVERAGSTNH